jgi:hypothetical protein
MKPICIICISEFVIDSDISVIHCGHMFHGDCLNDWLVNGNSTCPHCRYNASVETIVPKIFLLESDDRYNYQQIDEIATNNELRNEIRNLKDILSESEDKLMIQSTLLEDVRVFFVFVGKID